MPRSHFKDYLNRPTHPKCKRRKPDNKDSKDIHKYYKVTLIN